jgi:hypothetical protein
LIAACRLAVQESLHISWQTKPSIDFGNLFNCRPRFSCWAVRIAALK